MDFLLQIKRFHFKPSNLYSKFHVHNDYLISFKIRDIR